MAWITIPGSCFTLFILNLHSWVLRDKLRLSGLATKPLYPVSHRSTSSSIIIIISIKARHKARHWRKRQADLWVLYQPCLQLQDSQGYTEKFSLNNKQTTSTGHYLCNTIAFVDIIVDLRCEGISGVLNSRVWQGSCYFGRKKHAHFCYYPFLK